MPETRQPPPAGASSTSLEAVLVQQLRDGLIPQRAAARLLRSLRSEQRDYCEALRWGLRAIRTQPAVYVRVLQDLDCDRSINRGDMVILAKTFGCILPKTAGRRQARQALLQRFLDIERSCAAEAASSTRAVASTALLPSRNGDRIAATAQSAPSGLAASVFALSRGMPSPEEPGRQSWSLPNRAKTA